ncbi:unnamed protein product, partial [Brenthis ino]
MRRILLLTLAAIALAEIVEPVFEEEDLAQVEFSEDHERQQREAYVQGPYEEHVRVKRCKDEPRVKRDAVRNPRHIKQYEVHEHHDEGSLPSPPYEEMLAASAEHYHKVYAPDQPRSLNEVKPGPLTFGVPAVDRAAQLLLPESVASYGHAHPHANFAPAPSNSAAPVGFVPLSAAPLTVSDDLTPAAGSHQEKQHPHHHANSRGGGRQQHGKHYAEHSGKTSKGSNSDQYIDKGAKGFKTDERHRKEFEEAAGQKKKHRDEADHKGSHEEEAFGSRGAHFGEKKGHKKGHKTKGFHNKYHKDEFHKEHKFYDDYHKGGEHHRYGKFNAKHASNESGKKKVHHVNAGHDYTEHGKKGYSNKGHLDADHKGYNGKSGREEHHEKHSDGGKKGGKEAGSHWAYAKKN